MLGLLRRDPSLRGLPRWLAVAALNASLCQGARTALTLRAARDGIAIESFVLLLLALWIPLVVYLAFGRIGERCTEFDQVLPVTARRLWSVHVLATTAGALAVLTVAAGTIRLHDRLVGMLPGNPPLPQPGVDRVFVPLAAGTLLALALLHRLQPALRRVRSGRGHALLVAAAALGLMALAVLMKTGSRGWAVLPVAVAAILGFLTYRAVPAGFLSVSLRAERRRESEPPGGERARARSSSAAHVPPSRWRALCTAWRILYRGIAPGQLVKISVVVWFGFPILFVWGLFVAGLFIEYESLRFTHVVLSAYLLFSFLPGPMAPLHSVDPLPISRNVLCAFLLLPMPAVFALGYGAGSAAVALLKESVALVELQSADSRLSPPYTEKTPMVRVPVEHFEIAWDGQPPANSSPWGESQPAWSIPLFRGSRAVLYSPFSTPAESSPQFVALQISRAVEAVYGETVPPAEILRRYLTVDDAGVVDWSEAGAGFRERLRQLDPRTRLPVFPVVFTLIGLLFLACAALYMQGFRASVTDRSRLIVFFGILAAALLLHLAPLVSLVTGFSKDWVLSGTIKLAIRWLVATLPAGALSLWAAGLLLLVGGFLAARSRFERVEAPLPSSKPLA